MARKEREPGGRGPRRRRQKPPLDKLPDRRAMEGVMQQVVAGLRGESDQDTPLAKAQAFMANLTPGGYNPPARRSAFLGGDCPCRTTSARLTPIR